jgi:hypothetical protein
MATATAERGYLRARMKDDVYQSFVILRSAFTIAPILFGLDKFFNVMVDWPRYLAPWVNGIVPGTGQQFMYAVGAVEIAAGIAVAVAPWFGGYVVAAWLGGIIVNLLTVNPTRYYDVALRDLGLLLGALTLARLASAIPQHDRSIRAELKGGRLSHRSACWRFASGAGLQLLPGVVEARCSDCSSRQPSVGSNKGVPIVVEGRKRGRLLSGRRSGFWSRAVGGGRVRGRPATASRAAGPHDLE